MLVFQILTRAHMCIRVQMLVRACFKGTPVRAWRLQMQAYPSMLSACICRRSHLFALCGSCTPVKCLHLCVWSSTLLEFAHLKTLVVL